MMASLPMQNMSPPIFLDQSSHNEEILGLVNVFVHREKESVLRQKQLESRLSAESALLQNERHQFTQLQEKLAKAEWLNGLLEAQLSKMSEEVEILQQELIMERAKSQELESRVSILFHVNDMLVRKSIETETSGTSFSQKPLDFFPLHLENLRHQETIKDLRTVAKTKDEVMMPLAASISTGFRSSSPYVESESSWDSVVPTGISMDTSLVPDLPVQSDTQPLERCEGFLTSDVQ
ncbi:hypothetical protein BDV41DRAFT_194036 [Aspergillus transmontanensis]|uniref:Uncharacterized protein n=1 Tax=Aspergillus transmontanensis TaxID=1034304 RepID=A0A5N6VCH4_9EURO|nr:hypothetical protein BDV41DRAFT_194036 [Aspergillus transmontanensis]